MQGLDEAAKLHFRESKLPIILAVITSLRCQQFSNISPAPTTKQDKYFHKRGRRESARASKVGEGGGGVGGAKGVFFSHPRPQFESLPQGKSWFAQKMPIKIPERFRASEVIFKTFIAWL